MFTKNYEYKCSRPPIEEREAVERQMSLAHNYYNTLVEIERRRRDRVRDTLRRFCPDVLNTEHAAIQAHEACEQAIEAVKLANQAAQRRTQTREQSRQIKVLRAARKAAWQVHKESRTAGYARHDVKLALAVIDADARRECLDARRAIVEGGLYWGSYLTVEQAADAMRRAKMDPSFVSWGGDGHLAVQLQNGLSVEKALSGTDTRFRIRIDGRKRQREGRHAGQHDTYRATAFIRIGTEADRRTPIFTAVWFTLHRPLPEDGQIKWVHLLREHIGSQDRWKIVISLDNVPEKEGTATEGVVGINLGWRLMDDGSLRVATFSGDDGTEKHLCLSKKWMDRAAYPDHIRGIRDDNFNAARDLLVGWLAERQGQLPEWLVSETPHLHQWRSQRRLQRVVRIWQREENRFAGDEEMLHVLTEWAKQDDHLHDWEAFQRRNVSRSRREIYRRFVDRIRRSYHTVGLGKINYAQLNRKKQVDDDPERGERDRFRFASCGILQQLLKEKCGSVVDIDAKYLTQRCSECKRLDSFDAARELVRTCRHCGERLDQDIRHARNARDAASAMVLANPPGSARDPQVNGSNGHADVTGDTPSPKGRFQRRALAKKAKEPAKNDE